MPSDRTTGNGHKFKYRKFHLSIRKSFFTLRVADHWDRCPRRLCGLHPWRPFKTHLDMALRTWLYLLLL